MAKPGIVAGTAGDIAEDLPADIWRRLSAGAGTKGERFHDWAYLEPADLDAGDYDDAFTGIWTRGLLMRRNIADGLSPSSRHRARRARPSKRWSGWKAIAGQSKTASRQPRTNSASITTKPARGTVGIAMYRSSCLLSP
jgi:SRSO17 transposase